MGEYGESSRSRAAVCSTAADGLEEYADLSADGESSMGTSAAAEADSAGVEASECYEMDSFSSSVSGAVAVEGDDVLGSASSGEAASVSSLDAGADDRSVAG